MSLLDQMAQKFNEFERKFDMLTHELTDVKHDLKVEASCPEERKPLMVVEEVALVVTGLFE
jgi:hypothetical protein